MNKCINIAPFVSQLFDNERECAMATRIVGAMLEGGSPRISDLANQMVGNPGANYKAIQRFLGKANPQEALRRLFQAEAPFVIGDPTEIPRTQAWNTDYVGKLKDGKTLGFWLLTLATPFAGRAIPFHFVTYSSATIAQEKTSRNRHHQEAIADIRRLIGDKPLVLDREFSYLEFLQYLVAEQVSFVIRLHLGIHPPVFLDAEGQRVKLHVAPGKERLIPNVFYKGQVRVNLIAHWQANAHQPLWVMTNLEPRQGLHIYRQRMKIEVCFRDLKSLLGLDRLMNKHQDRMEKIIALLMLAYAICLLVGEAIRTELFGPGRTGKSLLFSGPFLLLKHRFRLSRSRLRSIWLSSLADFARLVLPPVPTYVS